MVFPFGCVVWNGSGCSAAFTPGLAIGIRALQASERLTDTSETVIGTFSGSSEGGTVPSTERTVISRTETQRTAR
jgi:hypothetical protein